MSFSSMTSMMMLENHVLPFLEIFDLPRLDGVDMSLHIACTSSNAWKDGSIQALPGFTLQPALFDLSNRKELMKFFPSLAKAIVMMGAPVPVESVKDAHRLAKLLRGANNSALTHMKNDGRSASVFVGFLQFGESVEHALVEQRHISGMQQTDEREEPTCHHSLPIAVPKPEASNSKFSPADTDCAFDIEFGWQGGSFMARAQAKFDLMEAAISDSSVTVDIACMDPRLTLHQRGVEACTDGQWTRATSGICAFPKGSAAAAQSLSRGVLCVFCVKEGAPRISAPLSRVSHALHLDELRGRRSGAIA